MIDINIGMLSLKTMVTRKGTFCWQNVLLSSSRKIYGQHIPLLLQFWKTSKEFLLAMPFVLQTFSQALRVFQNFSVLCKLLNNREFCWSECYSLDEFCSYFSSMKLHLFTHCLIANCVSQDHLADKCSWTSQSIIAAAVSRFIWLSFGHLYSRFCEQTIPKEEYLLLLNKTPRAFGAIIRIYYCNKSCLCAKIYLEESFIKTRMDLVSFVIKSFVCWVPKSLRTVWLQLLIQLKLLMRYIQTQNVRTVIFYSFLNYKFELRQSGESFLEFNPNLRERRSKFHWITT